MPRGLSLSNDWHSDDRHSDRFTVIPTGGSHSYKEWESEWRDLLLQVRTLGPAYANESAISKDASIASPDSRA